MKKAREKKGLSQAQVGRIIGVGQPAVDKWESGLTEPSATSLGKLARGLGVTIRSLLPPAEQEPFFCTRHKRNHKPGYRTFDQCYILRRP
jgi:transcriptional regulator with XRE-family HTH domain